MNEDERRRKVQLRLTPSSPLPKLWTTAFSATPSLLSSRLRHFRLNNFLIVICQDDHAQEPLARMMIPARNRFHVMTHHMDMTRIAQAGIEIGTHLAESGTEVETLNTKRKGAHIVNYSVKHI